MAHAKLVITNPKGLSDDIWQIDTAKSWSREMWYEALDSLAVDLQHIYDNADIDDFYRYRLGDTINLLRSMGVEVK